MPDIEKFKQLYHRYLKNELSEEELYVFLSMTGIDDYEQLLNDMMDDTWQQLYCSGQSKRVPGRESVWYKWAAAAVVFFLLSGSIGLLFHKQSRIIKATLIYQDTAQHIIKSSENKVFLTLANGRRIILDSASDGLITQSGNVKVIKLNGQIQYNRSGSVDKVEYNTITVPRGCQYALSLADGTKVWLDAESSLVYPTAFVGKERAVELNGQGYFDVVHNQVMPFHVKINKLDIEDLGTQFNVRAFENEETVKTTLIEGSVKIKAAGERQDVVMKPGQQVTAVKNGSLIVNNHADLKVITAWKAGIFDFKDASIETIMREMARWYDIEVRYEKPITEKFYVRLSRMQDLSEALRILQETGGVHFKTEGRKITVFK